MLHVTRRWSEPKESGRTMLCVGGELVVCEIVRSGAEEPWEERKVYGVVFAEFELVCVWRWCLVIVFRRQRP